MTSRVLVVDDDPMVRRLVASTLEDAGYEVTLAVDGQEAVDAAVAEHPDLVVLDLQMPRLDGRETFREMRRLGVDAPAIIISANGAHEARIELNADAAFEKPFDPAELLRRIAMMLAPSARGGNLGMPSD